MEHARNYDILKQNVQIDQFLGGASSRSSNVIPSLERDATRGQQSIESRQATDKYLLIPSPIMRTLMWSMSVVAANPSG